MQTLWVIFIVVMLFWKFRIGVAGYLAYIFLVPFMRIDIGEIPELGKLYFQWNIINIIILLAFFIHRQRDYDEDFEYDWRPLLPFVIYFGISLFLMPFQDGIPIGDAFSIWRVQVMKYLILPFVIWNDIRASHDSLVLYRNITLACIIIAVLYGLFLTTMPGINPYMIAISAANGEEFNLSYAAGNSGMNDNTSLAEGRIFGRISSVFSHPMTFGLFLGLALFFIYRNKKNINKWLLFGLTLFIITDIIVCGVRSVIGATVIAIIFLLIQSRNYKLFFFSIFFGCLLWTLITNIPALNVYLSSLFDFDSSNTSGSSLEMRLAQFNGCLQEIQETLIEGKGFGWTGYYLSQFESHPTMLHFESLIYIILCNSGIIGIILWAVMSIIIIKYNNWSERFIASLFNALYVFYIAYACITGEYGYMQYYILFYVLMLGEDLYIEENDGMYSEEEGLTAEIIQE